MKRTVEEIRESVTSLYAGDSLTEEQWRAFAVARLIDCAADVCERLDAMLERMPVKEAPPVEWFTCARHLGVEDGREVVCGKAAGHEGECSR